jgi:hypothetical protein
MIPVGLPRAGMRGMFLHLSLCGCFVFLGSLGNKGLTSGLLSGVSEKGKR